MKYKDKFSTAVEELKMLISENEITLQDIEDNTGVEQEFLSLIFDDNNILDRISRVFEFARIKVQTKNLEFKPYKVVTDGRQIKVSRSIEPKCSMYYDRATSNFYKFSMEKKRSTVSEVRKNIFKADMAKTVESFLRNEA